MYEDHHGLAIGAAPLFRSDDRHNRHRTALYGAESPLKREPMKRGSSFNHTTEVSKSSKLNQFHNEGSAVPVISTIDGVTSAPSGSSSRCYAQVSDSPARDVMSASPGKRASLGKAMQKINGMVIFCAT